MCGVSVCDRQASIMREPWPTRGCGAMGEGGGGCGILVHTAVLINANRKRVGTQGVRR